MERIKEDKALLDKIVEALEETIEGDCINWFATTRRDREAWTESYSRQEALQEFKKKIATILNAQPHKPSAIEVREEDEDLQEAIKAKADEYIKKVTLCRELLVAAWCYEKKTAPIICTRPAPDDREAIGIFNKPLSLIVPNFEVSYTWLIDSGCPHTLKQADLLPKAKRFYDTVGAFLKTEDTMLVTSQKDNKFYFYFTHIKEGLRN